MNLRQLHCARLIPAVVAVVLAASVALPGQAAGADGRRVAGVVDRLARAADPVAAYAELSLEDQAAVRQFLTAVYYPFWQWRHIGSETWGGVGQQTYRAWTQAEFKYCVVPDIGCQYVYPWLDMTAWADGRGTGSVG